MLVEFSAALLVFSVGVLDKPWNVISEGGSGLFAILVGNACVCMHKQEVFRFGLQTESKK